MRFTENLKVLAISLLEEDYSPEQMVGICKLSQKDMVAHECLYPFIREDKKQKGRLYKHLRCKGRRYRKRGALKDTRGLILNRRDIDQRPAIVDRKVRIGDLEVDTIIGHHHKGAVVTINDRCTAMLKMRHVSSREARWVEKAILSERADWSPFVKTITADNGKEFTHHEKIAENLNLGQAIFLRGDWTKHRFW